MQHETETFWTLLHDVPHWEFELFLIFLFDGIIGLLIWPQIMMWFRHHKEGDSKMGDLEQRVRELEQKLDSRGE